MRNDELLRYSRQIILEQIGGAGQEKLIASSVFIAGAGGLGAPALYYLAAAGVGRIGVADWDAVDISNLQRQIIHFTDDIGKLKSDSAFEKLHKLNPDIKIERFNLQIAAENISDIIKDYDFIIDGVDNFPTKFLINDAAVFLNKPFSHAGILRFSGQTFTHIPGGACYRCMFPAPPPSGLVPTCSEAGIIGPVAGVIGSIQALEAIKYITGTGQLLSDRLLTFDALTSEFRAIKIKHARNCPICGDNPTITELQDTELPPCDI